MHFPNEDGFLEMVLKTAVSGKFCKTDRNISMTEFIVTEVALFRVVTFF